MSTINEFNKANLKELRESINNALAQVEAQYGIKINAGSASYSGNEVTFKLKANTIGEGGNVLSKEAKQWATYAPMHGISLNVGDSITIQGKSFTISGWNTRAKKSPVEIINAKGQRFKTTAESILRNS